jgi:ribulose-5-phosphate 4-epimerase/fuculose-1-phosphate aldolase
MTTETIDRPTLKIGDVAYPSLKGKVSDAEWRTRVELAAIYRLIDYFGWFDLTMPGASAKIPGEPYYLFNPAGFMFDEITASSLVKLTLEGELAGDQPFEPVPRTWYPMRAVHQAREDANWVIHSHDMYGMALSARREKLLPISQSAGFVIAQGVSYHDYDGVEVYAERMAPLAESLGGSNGMLILHNHGLVTLGGTPWQAVARMYALRYACRVQLMAGRGDDLIHLPEEVIEGFREELRRGSAVGNPWPGLLRKLDRMDPSYKD